MNIEILSIGSEVLSGHTVNTNAAFLSKKLSKLGIRISRHTVLADNAEEIRKGLQEAKTRSSLLIVTGGLGPTLDDKTKEAADGLFDAPILLKNTLGTASGVFYSGKTSVFLLPGVPREMERMFTEEVLPLIQKHFPLTTPKLSLGRYLCLLREVEVNPFLVEMQKEHPDVEIGIYPSEGFLFVEFFGGSQKTLSHLAKKLEERFSSFYVGPDPIALSLHRELISRKKTLALAESCTGGAIAAALTKMPDASLYFLGSFVVYSNAWKERFLQVSRSTLKQAGAVSFEVVEEMLSALFRETDADFAIAISGIFGPSGGSLQKPVGTTYIGVAERGKKPDIGKLLAPPDRESAIQWGVNMALGALWRKIVHGVESFS